MFSFLRVFIVVASILFYGCASAPSPRVAVVSYLDVAKKQEYIHGAKSTLKIFRDTAQDLRYRPRPPAREELASEVDRYIQTQVKPIIGDFEANNNLATRLEVAELQLMCGLVYIELEEYRKVLSVLKSMEKRYGKHPDLLNASINRSEVGFRTLGDGMRTLNDRVVREFLTLPPDPSS